MTENRALDLIRIDCQSSDIERNGNTLDLIIQTFLRSQGYGRLADAILDVPLEIVE